jgi:alanyl-tRNA synthetase
VAKGVRRITAVTGRVASDTLSKITASVDELAAKFQCKPEDLPARVDALQDEIKKLKAQIAKGQAADLTGVVDKLIADAADVNGTKVVVGRLPGGTTDQVRVQVDRVRQKVPSAFICFVWEDDGKVPVLAALTPDLVKKGLKAGDIVKQVAAVVGGSGGGKPDLAQAGGKDATKIDAAVAKAKELGGAF